MEVWLFGDALKNFSITVGMIGVILGADLILGARLIRFVNKTSKTLVDLDKTIDSSKPRITLGFIFLLFSLLLLLLAKKGYGL